MKNKNNIYLIGPMGSGKSSVGKILAELMHQPFYDSDQEIEKRTGVDVAWIFEQEGEIGFRQREAKVIEELTQLNNIILSTGGGAITLEETRKNLSENGIIIYLQVSLNFQVHRVSHRRKKLPMLTVYNTNEKLAQLNEKRQHFYEALADFCYQTDNKDPYELAQKILADISTFKN